MHPTSWRTVAWTVFLTAVTLAPAHGQTLRFELGVEAAPTVLVNSATCHAFSVQNPTSRVGQTLDVFTGLETVYSGACGGLPFLGTHIYVRGTPDRIPAARRLIGRICEVSFIEGDAYGCLDGTRRQLAIFVEGVDLEVTQLTAPPGVLAGQAFEVSATVSGAGYGASPPTHMDVFQQFGESSYRQVARAGVPSIPAGSRRTISASATAPDSIGTYNYFARVDLHFDVPGLAGNNWTPDVPVVVFPNECTDPVAAPRGLVESSGRNVPAAEPGLFSTVCDAIIDSIFGEGAAECLRTPGRFCGQDSWNKPTQLRLCQMRDPLTKEPAGTSEVCWQYCESNELPTEVCAWYKPPDKQTAASRALSRSGFTDDPLVRGKTVVKAVHLTELRERIDAPRRKLGMAQFPWADPTITPGSTPIRQVHVVELRAALEEVYAEVRKTLPGWAGGVQVGGAVKAMHVTELRDAVTALDPVYDDTTLVATSSNPDVIEVATLGYDFYLYPKREGTAIITVFVVRRGVTIPTALQIRLTIS